MRFFTPIDFVGVGVVVFAICGVVSFPTTPAENMTTLRFNVSRK
jgi:hypothetical protein